MTSRAPSRALLFYVLRLLLVSPLCITAMVLQTIWSLGLEFLNCARLVYRDELRPMYSSYLELWTPRAFRRARSLARGASQWSRAG